MEKIHQPNGLGQKPGPMGNGVAGLKIRSEVGCEAKLFFPRWSCCQMTFCSCVSQGSSWSRDFLGADSYPEFLGGLHSWAWVLCSHEQCRQGKLPTPLSDCSGRNPGVVAAVPWKPFEYQPWNWTSAVTTEEATASTNWLPEGLGSHCLNLCHLPTKSSVTM